MANYKDSFEDLYLRHDYLRRITDIDEQALEKYNLIVLQTAKIMYSKMRLTFNKVGFYYDDIVSITRVYTAIFVGLHTFEKEPDKLTKFKLEYFDKHSTIPTPEVIAKRERNNLISFLRQKLQTCALSCKRKARNIVGMRETKILFAYTANSTPTNKEAIMAEPELFGYRKIYKEEEVEIRKRFKATKILTDKLGFQVIEIEVPSSLPSSIIYDGSEDGFESDFTLTADKIEALTSESTEEFLIEIEDTHLLERYKTRFAGMSLETRHALLTKFVTENKSNPLLRNEVKVARRLINNPEDVV